MAKQPLLFGDSTPHAAPGEGLLARPSGRLRDRRTTRFASVRHVDSNASRRRLVWEFLNGRGEHWSRRFEMLCIGLILLNVGADVLDSVPEFPFNEDESPTFRVLENFTCLVFTVEYLLRLWSCVESSTLEQGLSKRRKRLKWMLRGMPMVDLLVLSVFYIDIFLSYRRLAGFQTLRVVRLLRLLALFKMERQAGSFAMVFQVFEKKKADLFATLFLAMVLLVVASTAMYYVEVKAQPDKFNSIPATMWWSVTAMTTVGYGDIFPVTVLGKVLGSCVAFLGVGLFALPSGIISSGFVEVLEEERHQDADDLAELLDEDKASVDKLHEEVRFLQRSVDLLKSQMTRVEEEAQESRENQRKILEALQQLQATVNAAQPPVPQRHLV